MLMRTQNGVAIKIVAKGDYAMIHTDLRGNAEHYEGNEELSNVAVMVWDNELKPEYQTRREWVELDGLRWDVDRASSFVSYRLERFLALVRAAYYV